MPRVPSRRIFSSSFRADPRGPCSHLILEHAAGDMVCQGKTRDPADFALRAARNVRATRADFHKTGLPFIGAPVERQLYAYWERFREDKKRELIDTMQTDPSRNASSAVLKVTIHGGDLRRAVGLPEENERAVFNAVPAFYDTFSRLGV